MKSRLTLFTIPLTLLALAACGSSHHNKQTANTPSPPATTTSPPTTTSPSATTNTTTTKAATPAPAVVAHTVDIAANPSGMLAFTPGQITTAAGKVTIDFTNHSPLAHDIVVIGSATYSPTAKILGQTPQFQGGSKSFTVTLTPGKYYYYCSVPGHRQAGMFGILTVS